MRLSLLTGTLTLAGVTFVNYDLVANCSFIILQLDLWKSIDKDEAKSVKDIIDNSFKFPLSSIIKVTVLGLKLDVLNNHATYLRLFNSGKKDETEESESTAKEKDKKKDEVAVKETPFIYRISPSINFTIHNATILCGSQVESSLGFIHFDFAAGYSTTRTSKFSNRDCSINDIVFKGFNVGFVETNPQKSKNELYISFNKSRDSRDTKIEMKMHEKLDISSKLLKSDPKDKKQSFEVLYQPHITDSQPKGVKRSSHDIPALGRDISMTNNRISPEFLDVDTTATVKALESAFQDPPKTSESISSSSSIPIIDTTKSNKTPGSSQNSEKKLSYSEQTRQKARENMDRVIHDRDYSLHYNPVYIMKAPVLRVRMKQDQVIPNPRVQTVRSRKLKSELTLSTDHQSHGQSTHGSSVAHGRDLTESHHFGRKSVGFVDMVEEEVTVIDDEERDIMDLQGKIIDEIEKQHIDTALDEHANNCVGSAYPYGKSFLMSQKPTITPAKQNKYPLSLHTAHAEFHRVSVPQSAVVSSLPTNEHDQSPPKHDVESSVYKNYRSDYQPSSVVSPTLGYPSATVQEVDDSTAENRIDVDFIGSWEFTYGPWYDRRRSEVTNFFFPTDNEPASPAQPRNNRLMQEPNAMFISMNFLSGGDITLNYPSIQAVEEGFVEDYFRDSVYNRHRKRPKFKKDGITPPK
ncbi:hypothetical protein ADUPG1_007898, partial [Aduncisulcus paluster]